MEQKSMSIHDFKNGDIITRLKPSAPIPEKNMDKGDRGLIGNPYKFLGIANACIYVELYNKNTLQPPDDFMDISSILKIIVADLGPLPLPIDIWANDWSYYVDPYTMKRINSDNNEEESNYFDDNAKPNINDLTKALEKVLKQENYEEADKLKKQIKDIKKKSDSGNYNKGAI